MSQEIKSTFWEMSMRFQNLKFNNLCKIEFYIYFLLKRKPLGVRSMMSFWNMRKWLNKILYLNCLRN